MRNRALLALASVLLTSSVAATASAQIPTIPGLPPLPGQPDPNQQQPQQQQPQQAPQQQPGALPIPQLPPQLQQYLPPGMQQQPQQPGAYPQQPGAYPQQPGAYPQPYGQPQPGYGQQPYAPYGQQPQQPGYGYQPYAPQQPRIRTGLEIGYLYGVAIAYGAGVGIWIDSEAYGGTNSAGQAKKIDPGISLIAPILLGAAAPLGVFLADRRPMREGLPSAIASGLVIGAGEGLVISTFGDAKGPQGAAGWGFRGLARAEVIGSTIGGAGGIAYGLLAKPTPQRNMFLTSAVGWGAIVGYQFGGGGSNGKWSDANDATTLGGVVGYNIALGGAAVTSAFWSPTWTQLAWMWGGFGVGEVAGALVYPFYAASKGDPRRGLIFQGVASTVGMVAGAFIGYRRPNAVALAQEQREDEEYWQRHHFARVRGGGFTPMPGGMGASISGELW